MGKEMSLTELLVLPHGTAKRLIYIVLLW